MAYYRVLYLSHALNGRLSQSEMVARAFELAGHAVTHIRIPNAQIDEDKTIERGFIRGYLSEWAPNLVVVADGLRVSSEDRKLIARQGGLFCLLDENECMSIEHIEMDCSFKLRPSVTSDYLQTELSNHIDMRPIVACMGDSSEKRIRFVKKLLNDLGQNGVDVRAVAFGRGWPGEWAPIEVDARLAYASRASVGLLLFPSEDAESYPFSDAAVFVSDGTQVFQIGGVIKEFENSVVVSDEKQDYASMLELLVSAALSRGKLNEWDASHLSIGSSEVPFLDEQVSQFIIRLEKEGLLASGCPSPARRICLCGYYGTGNFGDEMILNHVAHDFDTRYGLVATRAIAVNPDYVWREHGIEAVGFSDHYEIASFIEDSSVLLITAGLLFDQGIRWTCGAGAMLGGAVAPDLPGLTSIAALANVCGTPLFFYGTGDGPLNIEASRRMLKAASELGAFFLPRNAESLELLRGCEIAEDSIIESSDILFGLDEQTAEPAAEWGEKNVVDFSNRRVVVVALRDWPGMRSDFEQSLAQSLDKMASQNGCLVLFVDFSPEDHDIHERVAGLMREKESIRLYGSPSSRTELLSILKSSWSAVCMRLHCALILGRFGKPSIGISYLPKVESLFRQLGQEDLLMPLDVGYEQLAQACDRLMDGYDLRSASVWEHVRVERDKLEKSKNYIDAAVCEDEREQEKRYWMNNYSEMQAMRRRITDAENQRLRLDEELHSARAMIEELQHRITALQNSKSYKLGNLVMDPLSKLIRR